MGNRPAEGSVCTSVYICGSRRCAGGGSSGQCSHFTLFYWALWDQQMPNHTHFQDWLQGSFPRVVQQTVWTLERCWGSTDTWLIYCANGQMRKQREHGQQRSQQPLRTQTYGSTLDPTGDSKWPIPTERWTPLYTCLKDEPRILDWRTFLLWLCHKRLLLTIKTYMRAVSALLSGLSPPFIWAKGHDDSGCETSVLSKGCYCFWEARRFGVCVCVYVSMCVCMSDQSKIRLINTYSLHWFPVAV